MYVCETCIWLLRSMFLILRKWICKTESYILYFMNSTSLSYISSIVSKKILHFMWMSGCFFGKSSNIYTKNCCIFGPSVKRNTWKQRFSQRGVATLKLNAFERLKKYSLWDGRTYLSSGWSRNAHVYENATIPGFWNLMTVVSIITFSV